MFETVTARFAVNDAVRLTRDVPELALRRGDLGVVISTWCSPWPAYEVEFDRPRETYCARVLLLAESLSSAQPGHGAGG